MSGVEPVQWDELVQNPSISAETLKEGRTGIMIHLDASASDRASLQWFYHPDCRCAYHYLILDDGRVVRIVPHDRRAWHAGKCKPADGFAYHDANSAFYGVACAARVGDTITDAQLRSLARVCIQLMKHEGWGVPAARITGHSAQAWERGRKDDPECDPGDPVLTVEQVLDAISEEGFMR